MIGVFSLDGHSLNVIVLKQWKFTVEIGFLCCKWLLQCQTPGHSDSEVGNFESSHKPQVFPKSH